ENINERGVPLFNDPLSYGGRVHLFPPVFYYLVSFFDFVGLNLAAKIISNLFFSLIVFAVYLISFQITNHRLISVMTSFFSSFIPLLFGSINEISIYSSVLLLTFFAVYFIININNNTHLNLAMFFLVLLVFTHSSAFLLIVGLLLFLLLLKLESFDANKREQELILFVTFLALWFNFIVYKNALLIHGPLVIWQNIPLQVLTNYFFNLNIIQSIYYIGLIPVILGIYAMYYALFESKKRTLLLLISLFLSILTLLLLKLISFRIGLIFLGLILVILSSHSLKLIYSYIKKTKMPAMADWFLLVIFILFCLTAVMPSFNLAFSSLENTPSVAEINALVWLNKNTANDSVILARPEEGYLINYFAKRKNVLDQDYLLVKDAQQRYDDVQSIFSLRLKTEVIRKLNYYDVNYIYFSEKFSREKNLYYVDDDCFDLVYNESVKIYYVRCKLNE
ncbi:MAG: hypothetical protein KKF95_03960, partial [Nanoarchaeota archaeon]|nr:hypothetical protein [Nanoarchaeota archaeon]